MVYSVVTNRGSANTQVLQICKEIQGLKPADKELVFDLTNYSETTPFSNLVLINALRRYKKEHSDYRLSCRPKWDDTYLQHIGFYKAIGIPIGKEVGEAIPSNTYVPVSVLGLWGTSNGHKLIGKYADELAQTIQFDRELKEMLSYLFYETIRNVFEHADVGFANVAAQYWPSINTVEIAIADAGCGVQKSLGKLFVLDDLELLKHACKPGVTAQSNYSYLDEYDPNRNSGYGLYNMKELALAYGGIFLICSGKYGVLYSRHTTDDNWHENEQVLDTDYDGTALCLRFRTDIDVDFQNVLDGTTKKGEMLSEHIKGAIRSASKSASGRYKIERFVKH